MSPSNHPLPTQRKYLCCLKSFSRAGFGTSSRGMACEAFPKSAQLFFSLELWLVGDEKELHMCVQTRAQLVSLWEVPVWFEMS